MTTNYIHGIHDAALADLMADKPGTILVTEAIGANPSDYSGGNYTYWTQAGHRVIVRLNNGYGSVGTIPTSDHYTDFAKRCANYVGASPGCDIVVIGNEPNWSIERPGDQPIVATQYAKCFDLCYQAIKALNPTCMVCPAAVAPYNEQTGWCIDYWQTLLGAINKCDALILHTYSRGHNPASIASEDKMDPPYQMYYSGFRAYRDFLAAVPTHYRSLPVYITETNQMTPWLDQNNGWVQAAYAEIDRWNEDGGQAIHALCLYRSNRDDEWSFTEKFGVQDDFKAAMARGYTVGTGPALPPTTPPTRPPTPPPDDEEEARDIDPALLARGVKFDFVTPPVGTWYWRITKAQWLENASSQVGPDHHILGRVLKGNTEEPNVPLRVDWPSGWTTVMSKRDDPNAMYNYDYAMGASLNEYSIQVAEGAPSDKATRIGMGKNGNPREHTSTWINFEWVQAAPDMPPVTPPVTPPGAKLQHPLPGSRITQHWGQSLENYDSFGMWGHNGVDFAAPEGTPIKSMAFGIVAYSDFDEAYGWYVRIAHDSLGCYSFMAHLKERGMEAGNVIQAGQVIGKVGSTGNSTGAHLHFEIRLMDASGSYKPGTPMRSGRVDPETWCITHGLKL